MRRRRARIRRSVEDGTLNETWTATTSGGVFGAAHQLSPEDEGQDDSPDRAHGARNAAGDVVAGWLLFVDGSRAQVTPVAPGPDPIFGDDEDDSLTGTNAGQAIYAAKGNDAVRAGGGSDDVFGEEGNDRLSGGGGNDALFGGPGRDVLTGGPGRNTYDGGGGRDTCVLSSRNERGSTTSCERIRIVS
jgi:Ca2+-binding RTX toxin-like protein